MEGSFGVYLKREKNRDFGAMHLKEIIKTNHVKLK